MNRHTLRHPAAVDSPVEEELERRPDRDSDQSCIRSSNTEAASSTNPAAVSTETPAIRESGGFECWLLRRLLDAIGNPPIVIELWDGRAVHPGRTTPQATLRFTDRSTLWKVLSDPQFQFCEGYSDGCVEVSGNVLEMLRILDAALLRRQGAGFRGQGFSRWLRPRRRNTLRGSRENIHRHYDIGNEFYKLWLDEQLVYTCAYFERPEMSLEEAQVAKLDHVCRKLQLQPGDTVIEAGCGWGALSLHMARKYGTRVKAFNISREQVQYARARAEDEGLADRVEFIEDDWRNITDPCDAFVSVGMLEHVGPENYETLGSVIQRSIGANGRGLIHSIGSNTPRRLDKWTERRIFPGAHTPSLSEMSQIFEPHGFSILDVENLRLHYARTLIEWLDRYERNVDKVREMFDERFVRMWRLYLSASIAAFETGWLQLFQVVFAPGTSNAVPMTRGHLCRSCNGC